MLTVLEGAEEEETEIIQRSQRRQLIRDRELGWIQYLCIFPFTLPTCFTSPRLLGLIPRTTLLWKKKCGEPTWRFGSQRPLSVLPQPDPRQPAQGDGHLQRKKQNVSPVKGQRLQRPMHWRTRKPTMKLKQRKPSPEETSPAKQHTQMGQFQPTELSEQEAIFSRNGKT